MTNEFLTSPWSASSRAHLPAGAHQVLWCLLNEDTWNPSHSREDGLASATVMRWKVLSQPAHLHRDGFLLNLGRLFVVWPKQAVVLSGPATFFLSFRLTWTQANFIFCYILVSLEVWCDISPALTNSTFREVHTDLSCPTIVGVSYKNTFLMEIIDLKTKKACPTFKFPALLSYRNMFNHFAFLTPFPPSYWSYTGTMALILLSWKAKNLCQQLQQKQELFQILSVGF